MAVRFANNASATLAVGITSTSTSVTVLAGQGALFPTLTGGDIFYATLVNSSNNFEIVRVTARSTDTLTVVRGQEGTAPRSFAAGDKIELRVTAAGMESKYDTTGGTLTGDVAINKANPSLRLTKTGAAQTAALVGTLNDAPRWGVVPGDAAAESGNNGGSNFAIARYADDGSLIDTPVTINRASGVTSFNNIPVAPASNPTADNQLTRKAYVDAGVAAANANANSRAPQGAATASGLTMSTSRLLGRTTADTGALEEITVGAGLVLSAGALVTNIPIPQQRSQLFTSSGSWTVPAGVTNIRVTVIGGGGGGSWYGFSGAPGGFAMGAFAVTPGATFSVVVGGGGNGRNSNGTADAGGTSSFGSLISASGGGGGPQGWPSPAPAGGVGSGGNIRTGVSVSAAGTVFGVTFVRGGASNATGALSWNIALPLAPGAAGSAGSVDDNGSPTNTSSGGVGGIVFIEWVG